MEQQRTSAFPQIDTQGEQIPPTVAELQRSCNFLWTVIGDGNMEGKTSSTPACFRWLQTFEAAIMVTNIILSMDYEVI